MVVPKGNRLGFSEDLVMAEERSVTGNARDLKRIYEEVKGRICAKRLRVSVLGWDDQGILEEQGLGLGFDGVEREEGGAKESNGVQARKVNGREEETLESGGGEGKSDRVEADLV